MTVTDLSRRALLTAPAALALTGGWVAAAQAEDGKVRDHAPVTVYFTRSGNTRVIAGTVCRALATPLFEIQAAEPYPEDYEETVERARVERDRGIEPPLAASVPDLARFQTVFLGFPIWGETAPPVIRTFLTTRNLRGKTIRPFITHGGYGLGDSLAVLARHAAGARIAPPFVMEADQERRTLTEVRGWLDHIKGDPT